jgi:hypothetical protein
LKAIAEGGQVPVREIERKMDDAELDAIGDAWESHVNGMFAAERRK